MSLDFKGWKDLMTRRAMAQKVLGQALKYIGKDMNGEIGDTYQIFRDRVRQLENNMVKKMSAFFEKKFPDFASYKNSGKVGHVESL